jgi:uncharacterized repeat protein (TIGR03803 family)
LVQFPIQKPQPEKIVGQLCAEEPLAAHRVEGHQDAALEQLLGRNRRPALLGIQLVKQGREPGEDLVHPCFDGAQRMVRGHALVQIEGGQELRLGLGFSTHGRSDRARSAFVQTFWALVFQQPAKVLGSFPYTSGLGTVYRFTTNGGITSLFSFNGTNGFYPWSGLVSGPDNCLYGTARHSGIPTGPPSGHGALFKISMNGAFTLLLAFNNTNGSGPTGELAFDPQGRLHGVTASGGAFGRGTIYRFTTNSGLTTLIHFDGTNGAFPASGLLYTREGNLLGTTAYTFNNPDPNKDFGTLFRLQPSGELTTLLRFNGTNGIHPFCEMIQGSNGFIYGPVLDLSRRINVNGGTLLRFSDVPTILSVSRNVPMVTLTWTSWPNRSYRIYMNSSPSDPYAADIGSFTGAPGETTTASVGAFLPTQAVFRVTLLPPP